MKYTIKMGILKFSVISATTAIALSSTTNAWSANLTFVNTNRNDLVANDFLDWSEVSSVPVSSGTQFTTSSTVGGLTVTGNLAGAPGEIRTQNTGSVIGTDSPSIANATENSEFWNGNFAPGDGVYWNKGNGKLSLTFSDSVSSVGTQLNSLFYFSSVPTPPDLPTPRALFQGTITAFLDDGSSETFTANGAINALANNTAAFFGVSSDSADIKKVEFDVFDIPTDTAVPASYFNYAINRVSIGNPNVQSVPEPFTIFGTLFGGATALKMRKRLKANHKH
jgi:hypothetical protein